MPQMLGMTELFQQMAAALVEAFRSQPGTSRVETEESRGQEVGYVLREFCKMNPPTFSGELDPLVAEDWLKQITKVLNGMKVTDDETRVLLVTFQHKADAEVWWESVKTTSVTPRIW